MKTTGALRDLVQAIDAVTAMCPSASVLREERLLDALEQAKHKLRENGYRFRQDVFAWVKD